MKQEMTELLNLIQIASRIDYIHKDEVRGLMIKAVVAAVESEWNPLVYPENIVDPILAERSND